MSLVAVPNAIHDAINAAIDAALKKHPDAAKDRQYFYDRLLSSYDENGYIPEFSLERKVEE